MSYQPRSTNPYIMEKKLNECVGGGGFDPSVLEEIQAEISILGSENATMAQDIIDIKGSLNTINANLNKHTIDNSTVVTLTDEVDYTTLTDGYFRIACNGSANNWVKGNINGINVMTILSTSAQTTSALDSVFVRKGSVINYHGTANASSGAFYPLA